MFRKILFGAVLAASCFVAPLAQAGKSGGGAPDFIGCKRGPVSDVVAQKVLSNFLHRWPAADLDAKNDVAATLSYRRLLRRGAVLDESSKLVWIDRNNLALIYHQFMDGTIVTAINKVGYIAWRPSQFFSAKASTQSDVQTQGRRLLNDWAMGVPTVIHCHVPKRLKQKKELIHYLLPGPFQQIGKFKPHFFLRDSAAHLTQTIGDRLPLHDDQAQKFNQDSTAAAVGFHHDRDNTANTFTMHVAMGLGYLDSVKDEEGEEEQTSSRQPAEYGFVLPYITADRVNKSNPQQLKKNSTDLAVGTAFVAASANYRLGLRLQGDTDDRFQASILYGAAQFSLRPTKKKETDHNQGHFGLTDCLVQEIKIFRIARFFCDYNFDLDYDHVYNPGDFNPDNIKQYFRIGGDVTGVLTGLDAADVYDGPGQSFSGLLLEMLSKLSFTASYKAMHDLSRNGGSLSRFDASANFKLSGDDSDGSTSIAVTYTNGREDVTLSAQKYWELQLKASY